MISELLGQTFDVDDGLLKKIRVAQFQPGKARIVLEVEDRSDYTTFLLTDPPRLIIDVHGKDVQPDTQARNGQAKSVGAGEGYDPTGAERKAANERPVKAAADGARTAAVAEAKPPGKDGRRPASPPIVASDAGTKKIVVDADDDDDSAPDTVAKLDPPEIKPQTRAATTLTRPTAAKGSSRSKSKPPLIFPDAREASPTANGDRSLIRALGLKIGKIVIDPRPRRTRYRNYRSQRPGRERSGA